MSSKLTRLTGWPESWGLPQPPPTGVTWLQLELQTQQLQALPQLSDGGEPSGTSVATLPVELIDDDGDVAAGRAAPPSAGAYHVALSLHSNHIATLEPDALASLPWLCSLDLSLNHVEVLTLTPSSVPRLCTLRLSNNRLTSVSELGELRTLRHLDVSLNQLQTLDGLDGLEELIVLVASGNQIGALPAKLPHSLRLVDLQHNALRSVAGMRLGQLRTLRLSNNRMPAAELSQLSTTLAELPALLRLTCYGNPCAAATVYPDALMRMLPRLLTLDHVPLPAASLLDGSASRASLSEAVDAIVNNALAQHAAQVAKQQAAHYRLASMLARQQEVAKAALRDYEAVTAKAERIFQEQLRLDAKGGMGAVEHILQARQKLLANERVTAGRTMDEALRPISEILTTFNRGGDSGSGESGA